MELGTSCDYDNCACCLTHNVHMLPTAHAHYICYLLRIPTGHVSYCACSLHMLPSAHIDFWTCCLLLLITTHVTFCAYLLHMLPTAHAHYICYLLRMLPTAHVAYCSCSLLMLPSAHTYCTCCLLRMLTTHVTFCAYLLRMLNTYVTFCASLLCMLPTAHACGRCWSGGLRGQAGRRSWEPVVLRTGPTRPLAPEGGLATRTAVSISRDLDFESCDQFLSVIYPN